MPYKRKNTKTTYKPRKPWYKKKKTVRKSYRSKKPRLFKEFVSNDPFRPRMNVKLTYTQTSTYSSGTNGAFGTSSTFSLNSLYDPDISGVGHQPYGYDQLTTIYNRYKVNGVLLRVTMMDTSDNLATVGMLLKTPTGSETLTNLTLDQAREKPMCVTRNLVQGANEMVKVQEFIPLHRVFGWTRAQFSNDMDNSTAGVGGSPGSQPKIEVAVAHPRGSAGVSAVVQVTLTYYATMYDRKIIDQS